MTRTNSVGSPFGFFDGKSVLVTGGTGSFGTAFIRRLLDDSKAARVAVYSRDELKQFEMQEKFNAIDPNYPLRFFIGDIRDVRRLRMALRGIDYVVHAAAMKQVTTAEYNPFECIHTNVLGAENVVNACLEAGVKGVVALSTDKAASPVNLYGASKLASDKIFVAANHLSGKGGTRFSVVRYGNVLGSRGSVIPYFRRLIEQGSDHLPITDQRMTRFWITLRQGCEFVASSMAMMRGGELFVPKIPSMKIIDVAKALAPDLEHRFVGIRPGEKLHEVMITRDDARNTFDLGNRYVIEPAIALWQRDPLIGAAPVSQDFEYSSDTNSQWLTAAQLHTLMREDHA